jgi:hypothetical protein
MKNDQITAKLETITPELGAAYLEKNYESNRKLRRHAIETIADHYQFYWLYWFSEIDMPLGEWRIYEWLHEVYWRHYYGIGYPPDSHMKENEEGLDKLESPKDTYKVRYQIT